MKSKKFSIIFISFNIIFFLINIIAFLNISNEPSKNILNNNPVITQNDTNNRKNIVLQELITYLNSSPDTDLMIKQFGLIKIASDPLYEFDNSDTSENNLLSVSYGIEGMFKLDENISIKVTIINDDTLNNGNYIYTTSEQSFESSYYMIENTFLIFEVYINSNLNEKQTTDAMINVIQFKQKFYNHYNSYLKINNY